MNQSIALASVPKGAKNICEIEIRGKQVTGKIIKLPFVRNGKILV
jgi:glycine cleavage system aminomethyltransferase T